MAEWFNLRAQWLAIPSGSSGSEDFRSQLARLSLHGIPPSHRNWVWPALLQKQCNRLIATSPMTYRRLVAQAKAQAQAQECEHGHVDIIQQDTSRISNATPEQFVILERILRAFDARRNGMKYCPGMSDICMILLPHMEEEFVFWTLSTIIEKLLPGYHDESLLGYHVDCRVLEELLNDHDPILHDHLQDNGVTMHFICTQWFLSIFAGSLPVGTVEKLFDRLIALVSEGIYSSKVVLAFALAILMFVRHDLLKVDDPGASMEVLKEFCSYSLKDKLIEESLLEICDHLMNCIENDQLKRLRKIYRAQVVGEFGALESQSPHNIGHTWPFDAALDQILGNIGSSETGLKSFSPSPGIASPWGSSRHGIGRRNTLSPTTLKSINASIDFSHPDLNGVAPSFLTQESIKWKQLHRLWKTPDVKKDAHFIGELAELGFDGIPDDFRSRVWPLLLSVHTAKIGMLSHNYKQLVEDAHGWDTEKTNEIDRDLRRMTHLSPEHATAIRRILLAYSEKNKSIGYCQGMNIIVAFLIAYMDEEASFWALAVIVESLLPEYHVKSMIGLHMDCIVIEDLLRKRNPFLCDKLRAIGVNMQLLCTEWLMACFISSLPPPCYLPILDMFFSCAKEGRKASRVLVGTAISLLIINADTVMTLEDAGSVKLSLNQYIETLSDNIIAGQFLSITKGLVMSISGHEIEQLRKVRLTKVASEFAAFERKRHELRERRTVETTREGTAEPKEHQGNRSSSLFSLRKISIPKFNSWRKRSNKPITQGSTTAPSGASETVLSPTATQLLSISAPYHDGTISKADRDARKLALIRDRQR